jgi:TonB family protein
MFAILLMLAAPADVAPPRESVERGQPMIPATNPGSWATNDDYPAAAMRDEREGTSEFLLTIAPDGLPQRCEITTSSGHTDLDATTCRLLMERARFRPGRDEKGIPAGGTYFNRIRWQIPDGHISKLASAGFSIDQTRDSWPRGPSPLPAMLILDTAPYYPAAAHAAGHEGDVHMAVSVDSLGKVTGCSVIESSMSADLDKAACAVTLSQGAFTPALDSAGKPTKGVVPSVFRWLLPRDGTPSEDAESPRALRKFPLSDTGTASMSVLLDADGKASGCSYTKSGDIWLMAPGINPCDTIGGIQRYIPFVDVNGAPVARRITLRAESKIESSEGTVLPDPQ